MGCNHDTATDKSCLICDFDPFVKNNFFTGKMMSAREFITETAFHAEKMRHHNVRLHGWGVVCGLDVREHATPACQVRFVRVTPGSAIDCCGHEILVPNEEMLDIAAFPAVSKLQTGAAPTLHTLQVCVRFKQCPTEEVPVLYDDCGCDDTQCAPNRILESYELDVLVDPPLPAVTHVQPANVVGVYVPAPGAGLAAFVPVTHGRYVHLVEPATPSSVVQLDLMTNQRMLIAAGAKVVTMAVVNVDPGASTPKPMLFVVTEPTAAEAAVGPELRLRVFAADTGAAVDAGTDRRIASSTVAAILTAHGTTKTNLLLATVQRGNGALVGWTADTTTGVKAAANPTVTVNPLNLANFTLAGDGSVAYGIDTPSNKVKIVDPATGAAPAAGPAEVPALPAAAVPVAIATFIKGSTRFVGVASAQATGSTLYIVDVAGGVLRATLPLGRRPVQIIATVADWLHVYEEEGGTGYWQSVDLAALAGAGAPEITAVRVAGTAVGLMVAVSADGGPLVLDAAAFAGLACDEIVWSHLAGCADCDTPNCVVLATITNYRPSARMTNAGPGADPTHAHIDDRLGRRVLASTQMLQAWLECVKEKGGGAGSPGGTGPAGPAGDVGPAGPAGPPGPGLEPDLTRIRNTLDWQLGQTDVTPYHTVLYTRAGKQIVGSALIVEFTKPVWMLDEVARPRLPAGFPRVFEVQVALANEAGGLPFLSNRWNVQGVIVPVEPAPAGAAAEFVEVTAIAAPLNRPYAALWAYVFEPRPFEWMRGSADEVFVRLRADLIVDREKRAVDAEYVRAQFLTGDRPDGAPDGIQGGTFESWFFHRRRELIDVNRAGRSELIAVPGIGPTTADAILRLRRRTAFVDLADLRRRARISDADWELMKDVVTVGEPENE